MDQRIHRLKALLKVKQSIENESKYNYLKARRDWLDEVNKSHTLDSFRAEYRNQLQMMGQQGAPAAKIRQIALFIQQLDKNIEVQRQDIEQRLTLKNQKKMEYAEAKKKTMSVNSIVDKLLDEERRRQEKLSQKENDEYAQNIWYSNDKKVP